MKQIRKSNTTDRRHNDGSKGNSRIGQDKSAHGFHSTLQISSRVVKTTRLESKEMGIPYNHVTCQNSILSETTVQGGAEETSSDDAQINVEIVSTSPSSYVVFKYVSHFNTHFVVRSTRTLIAHSLSI